MCRPRLVLQPHNHGGNTIKYINAYNPGNLPDDVEFGGYDLRADDSAFNDATHVIFTVDELDRYERALIDCTVFFGGRPDIVVERARRLAFDDHGAVRDRAGPAEHTDPSDD